MPRVITLTLTVLLLSLCSCTQINEMPIEGENWKQTGTYKDHSWSIIKSKEQLIVELDEQHYQIYPELKIQGLVIERCGISSSGPSSNDHGLELPENGHLYKQSPYAYSFKRDQSLHIFTLSIEVSSEGVLYLQSIFSIKFKTKEITLTEIIHNPSGKSREAQFSYLIHSNKPMSVFPNYDSIFPLKTSNERDLQNWAQKKPIPKMSALHYRSKNEMIISQDKQHFSFSSNDLKNVSFLNEQTLSFASSFYQARDHERVLGRVALIAPYRDISFISKINIIQDLPKKSIHAKIEPSLESLESLNIK
jgi:hypothetical protein